MQEKLKALTEKNKEVIGARNDYIEKKLGLKKLQADLYLYGEKEIIKALGKEKPSQKDKEYFIQLKTLGYEAEVENAYSLYKGLEEEYKILKYEFRALYFSEPQL